MASGSSRLGPSSFSRVRIPDPRLLRRARAVRTLLVVDALLAVVLALLVLVVELAFGRYTLPAGVLGGLATIGAAHASAAH